MPNYDFKCKVCSNKFSAITTIEGRRDVACPSCGSKEKEQLITGCSVKTGNCSIKESGFRRGG